MIGQRVQNYELKSLLGQGGMGAVYLAVHPLIDRKVAIKILRRELAEDKALVERFINEARAANAIKHPNIIEVMDVGLLPDGLPYIVMELLEGESLARRLDRGPLRVDEAVEIACMAASALTAAHEKGIVHRDLKPDNLFLASSGAGVSVKVLDFGIAKLRRELTGALYKTSTGSLLGTPPYMSPEQCRGVSDQIDHRTDVYALGVILYEMLCGVPPFVGEGFGEILMKHMSEAPVPPRQHNPAIPPPLEAAILGALAKPRDGRIATMDAFAARLHALPTRANLGPTLSLPTGAAVVETRRRPTPRPTTFSTATGAFQSASVPPRRRGLTFALLTGAVVVAGAALFLTFGLPRDKAPSLDRLPAAAIPAPPVVPALPVAEPAPPVAEPAPPPDPAPVAEPAPRRPSRARRNRAAAPAREIKKTIQAPAAVAPAPAAVLPAPAAVAPAPVAAPRDAAAPAGPKRAEKW